jgi:hypothetical protein
MSWKPWHKTRQIHTASPPAARICAVGVESGGGNFEVRLRTPDSRLRAKVSIYFSPNGPYDKTSIDISNDASLWIHAADQMRSGGSSALAPTNDLESQLDGTPVTRDAPLTFPVSAGLLGYGREFVTASDFISAWVSIRTNGTAGEWWAQAQWQPEGQRLPDDEWNEVVAQCSLEVLSLDPWAPEIEVG